MEKFGEHGESTILKIEIYPGDQFFGIIKCSEYLNSEGALRLE